MNSVDTESILGYIKSMTQTPTSQAIAATSCVHLHGQFDVNRDWPCRRAARVHMLTVWAQNIETTLKRANGRVGYRRAADLRQYAAEETARLARHMDRHALPECSGKVA